MSYSPASFGIFSPSSKNLLGNNFVEKSYYAIKIHDLIIYYIVYTCVNFYEKILGLSIKFWLVLIKYFIFFASEREMWAFSIFGGTSYKKTTLEISSQGLSWLF